MSNTIAKLKTEISKLEAEITALKHPRCTCEACCIKRYEQQITNQKPTSKKRKRETE